MNEQKRTSEENIINCAEQKSGVSRRSFLTGVVGVGALAAMGGLAACSPAPTNSTAGTSSTDSSSTTSAAPAAPSSVDKTYDTDLVIVGGGGSGLACAVQAALDGTNFILLEKNTQLGGNASFVEGMFAINSKMSQELGIHVTAAKIVEDELVRGQHRQNGAFWLDLCNKSAGNIDWCLEQGVEYSGTIDDYYGGLHPTFHWFKDNKAAIGYVEPMIKRVEELGIDVHLSTAANQLIMEDGKVAGIYAKGPDGVTQYNAKAVIFATGGFGGNPEYIGKQGWDTEYLYVVGSPNAAGDAYRMAMEVGVKDFMPDSCQSILYNIPALPPIDFHNDSQNPVNGYFGIAAGGPVLWINEQCERYSRENLTADNLVLQCIPGKDNKANFVVFNQAIFDTYFGTTEAGKKMFDDAVANDGGDTLVKADSLEALATAFDLDKDAFTKTVNRYNELCGMGVDEDLGKPADLMISIDQGPFYIAKLGYSFFFECGGVTTDIKRRALNDELEPIPGLYAIGNDGNMNYRDVYTINMPGTAFGNQVNSGREAAQNAAEYLKG
ncbi:MAG: FAD-dependent oxidoreductase [Raoultibacter sp.]